MSKSITVYTLKDIQAEIKKTITKELDFIYMELQKLRLRMNDLESVVRIYDGKLKIMQKNEI